MLRLLVQDDSIKDNLPTLILVLDHCPSQVYDTHKHSRGCMGYHGRHDNIIHNFFGVFFVFLLLITLGIAF